MLIKFDVIEKRFKCHTQCCGNFFNIDNGYISLTILNACNVTSVKVGRIRQVLLRHVGRLTEMLYPLPYFFLDIHGTKVKIC